MGYTMIDINKEQWKVFKKWCANNETTMKAELNKMLNKFLKEAKK